jgi:hypothetical protein
LRLYSLCNILSDERMGLSFTFAAGPRQLSYSHVRVPRDSWPHFTVSDSRLSQPRGRGPRIYIPTGIGWPSYTPRHWVPFRHLLRLAGLRRRYSTLPPHGSALNWPGVLAIQPRGSPNRKHRLQLSLYRRYWRVPRYSPDIVDVFTGRYQVTNVTSRDRCTTTLLHVTIFTGRNELMHFILHVIFWRG